MFHRNRLINSIISFAFLVGMASCDLGSGCGCAVQSLPPGGLPADQTIEGGAQLRVTSSGFSKITSLIPAVVNDALAGGFCIPRDNVLDAGVAEATICGTAAGGFFHSDQVLIVDAQGRLRGTYDDTRTSEVDQMLEDLIALLARP